MSPDSQVVFSPQPEPRPRTGRRGAQLQLQGSESGRQNPYGRRLWDTGDATFRGTFRNITRTLRGHYAGITQGHTHITRTLRDLTRTLRGHYAGFTQDNTHITRTLRNITRTLHGRSAGVTQDNTHISHIPMGMAMLMNPQASCVGSASRISVCAFIHIPIYVECARKSHCQSPKSGLCRADGSSCC